MFNTKTTKRALLSSVLSLIICFTMLLGTTFAWFTDSAISADNKIVAGTLDVELYQWTSETESTNISASSDPVFSGDILWEPGKTEVVYLSIKNEGSLALKYQVALEVTGESTDSLLDVMSYTITPDAKYGEVTAWAGNGIYVDSGVNATDAVDVELAPDAEHFFALSIHMDEEAGNEYQSEWITFDIKVLAAQLAYEEDSFDNTYDEDATYPYVAVSNVTNNTVENVIDSGDLVKVGIPVGAPTGEYVLKMSNKRVANNADGTTAVAVDVVLEKDGAKVTDDGVTVYTVEFNVGANKRIIEVAHNGYVVDDYTYDIDTGILTITTRSFSPFSFVTEDVRVVTGLSGTGTEADPYLINDYFDLAWFRDNVNTYTQDGSNQYRGKYVKLTSDINLNGVNWEPIGDNSTNDHEAFIGTFDGDGHTISNLYINANKDHLGFFARTGSYNETEKAVVKNLNFINVDVSADITYHWTSGHGDYVGGVIANAGGNTTVENVNISGYIYVDGCAYVGGIIGHGYPTVKNCSVTAEDGSYIMSGYWSAGAIVGFGGEGSKFEDCSVVGLGEDGLFIYGAYGAAAAVCGNARGETTGNNLYASNIEISGDDYALGYIFGNGGTLTNSSFDNVRLPSGATASDASAFVK